VLKVIVLAGDYGQAATWCRRHCLEEYDPQLRILSEGNWRRMVIGMHINEEDRVVVVGTAWRRRDFHNVWEELQRRGWNGEYEAAEW